MAAQQFCARAARNFFRSPRAIRSPTSPSTQCTSSFARNYRFARPVLKKRLKAGRYRCSLTDKTRNKMFLRITRSRFWQTTKYKSERFVMPGESGVLFAVNSQYGLVWFQHKGRDHGTFDRTDDNPRKVGVGAAMAVSGGSATARGLLAKDGK